VQILDIHLSKRLSLLSCKVAFKFQRFLLNKLIVKIEYAFTFAQSINS